MDMLFFIKWNLALVALYLAYRLLFNRMRSFAWNRMLLLLIPVVAALIPFLVFRPVTQLAVSVIPDIINLPSIEVGQSGVQTKSPVPVWMIVYFLGLGIALAFHGFSLFKLYRFYAGRDFEMHDGLKIYSFSSRLSSFSFFNRIYINPEDPLHSDIIVAHESQHVRLQHSYDNIYFTLLKCVLWFNPVIYLLHKSLRNYHEYEVDAVLSDTTNAKNYLNTLFYGNELLREMNLTNSLYTKNNLLNRITMIQSESKSSTKWKYFMLLPVVGGLVFANACSEPKDNMPVEEVTEVEIQEEIISPDKMGDLTSQAEFPGGMTELTNYLMENIKYPPEAKEQGLSGKVHVSFVVSSTGKVKDVKVVRGIHPKLDEEALRVISSMPDWQPAFKGDKAVGVQFMLPIQFSLNNTEENS